MFYRHDLTLALPYRLQLRSAAPHLLNLWPTQPLFYSQTIIHRNRSETLVPYQLAHPRSYSPIVHPALLCTPSPRISSSCPFLFLSCRNVECNRSTPPNLPALTRDAKKIFPWLDAVQHARFRKGYPANRACTGSSRTNPIPCDVTRTGSPRSPLSVGKSGAKGCV